MGGSEEEEEGCVETVELQRVREGCGSLLVDAMGEVDAVEEGVVGRRAVRRAVRAREVMIVRCYYDGVEVRG